MRAAPDEVDNVQAGWIAKAALAARRAWGWVFRAQAMEAGEPKVAAAAPAARFLGEGGLRHMGEMAQSQARKIKSIQAEAVVREAFAQGRWVAATDASVEGGRSSIAWGIFNPQGELAGFGAEPCQARAGGRASIDVAEFEAIKRAGRELERLGASSALCLSDSLYSVRGVHMEGLSKGRQWQEISQGRFELGWVPREALGPANDAARAALGLRPEKGVDRPWSGWLDGLARGGAGLESKGWAALSDQAKEAFSQARAQRRWVALADACLSAGGKEAQMGVAIFDAEGELQGMFAERRPLARRNDLATASAWALERAAKKLAQFTDKPSLCLCGAIDPSRELPAGKTIFVKAAPAALGPAQALASRALSSRLVKIGDKNATLGGQFKRWMRDMEAGSGLFGLEGKAARAARIAQEKAGQESPAQNSAPAPVAPGAAPAPKKAPKIIPTPTPVDASAFEGPWTAVWARASEKGSKKLGVAAALFDARGRFMQEVSCPLRVEPGSAGEMEAVRAWLGARLGDWGAKAWEAVEALPGGSPCSEAARAALAPLALRLVARSDSPVAAPLGAAGWQAWMEQAKGEAPAALASPPAQEKASSSKKDDWRRAWEAEVAAQAALPPITINLARRRAEPGPAPSEPKP